MRIVYVSPNAQECWIDAAWRPTKSLDVAVKDSMPGDLIRLVAGDYPLSEPLVFPRSGHEGAPIILRGDTGSQLKVNNQPDYSVSANNPGRDRFAAFQLIDVAHIRIENLSIIRSWPSAVYIENSHDLCFTRLDITAGTYAVYANGATTQAIEITQCRWTQDETIWRSIRWDDIHDGDIHPDGKAPFRYLNGAFFGADDITGNVLIARNDIRDCYNGVRMDVSAENLAAPIGSFNRDVRIFDNNFSYIRDNPVEPEATAVGWWIGRNRFYNCHKLFSQDGVRGGFWYYFGNICWFDSRPGPEGDEYNGGAVFKLGKGGTVPQPDFISACFHNSFFLRQKYTKKGTTRGLINARNAIEHADPSALPPDFMPDDQPFFGDADGLQLSAEAPLPVIFSGDLANHATYPAVFDRYPGVLDDPRSAQTPLFEDGLTGRFDLRRAYQTPYDSNLAIPMPDGNVWTGHQDQWPGAITDGKRYEGPQFVAVNLEYVRDLLSMRD